MSNDFFDDHPFIGSIFDFDHDGSLDFGEAGAMAAAASWAVNEYTRIIEEDEYDWEKTEKDEYGREETDKDEFGWEYRSASKKKKKKKRKKKKHAYDFDDGEFDDDFDDDGLDDDEDDEHDFDDDLDDDDDDDFGVYNDDDDFGLYDDKKVFEIDTSDHDEVMEAIASGDFDAADIEYLINEALCSGVELDRDEAEEILDYITDRELREWVESFLE